jgi:hypothetical protein
MRIRRFYEDNCNSGKSSPSRASLAPIVGELLAKFQGSSTPHFEADQAWHQSGDEDIFKRERCMLNATIPGLNGWRGLQIGSKKKEFKKLEGGAVDIK